MLKLYKPSGHFTQSIHISDTSRHSLPKMYVLPPHPDLTASVTNPACTTANGLMDLRSRSVIGRRGTKLYRGEWVCASGKQWVFMGSMW